MNKSRIYLLLSPALLAFLPIFTSPALAQDLPPEPQAQPEQELPQTIEAEKGNIPPLPSQVEAPAQQESKVVDGPLQSQRQQLYNQIKAAESGGIGIKNYMMAFNYIEDMASKGQSEEAIRKRMVPLVTALSNQLKTKQYLKTRPTQAASTSSRDQILAPGQNVPPSLGMFGGMGGGDTEDLIRRVIKQQGGGTGSLPSNLPSNIPPSLKQKLPQGIDKDFIKQKLKDPRVREMLKKYQGKL